MQKARSIIDANLDCEIHYIFTNNDAYLKTRTRLIPFKEKEKPKVTTQQQSQPQKTPDPPKEDGKFTQTVNNFFGMGKKTDAPPANSSTPANPSPSTPPNSNPNAPTEPQKQEPKTEVKAGPELSEKEK